ncbi:MAG: LysE family translocator [Candidatus Delongbacteria bacterium]|jgi:threonine/homoserine/homoserine lactone efflux protein|nr:LysE family translocator [Candidatus Delongbacteria bacterium]
MDSIIFIKGILIGIAVSVPLGPMAMMVVTRTLNQSRKTGFFSGLGVATADTMFAIVAIFGLSAIIDFFFEYELVFKLIAAAILIFLGIRLFTKNPAVERRKARAIQPRKAWSNYTSMVLFTLSNPAFVLVHGGLLAAFGLITKDMHFNNTLLLVIGVVSGAVLWWFFLTWILSRFGKKLSLRHLLWVNKIAGIVILIFGLMVLMSTTSLKLPV